MAIGGLGPLIPNSGNYSFSYGHHTIPYVFVVHEGLKFGPLKQLFHPFDFNVWMVVLSQLLILILLIELMRNSRRNNWLQFIFGHQNRYTAHNLFVSLLGIALPNSSIPRRNFTRLLLMTWLLWTFELRNFYQGKMYDSLRLGQRVPTPTTIAELIDQDYVYLNFYYSDFYPKNKTQIMMNADKRLKFLDKSKERYTTAVLLDYLAKYRMDHWNTSALTFLDENIYIYQCVIFFPKHSMLLPAFNNKFKLLVESGITSHLAQKHVHPFFRNSKTLLHNENFNQITHDNLKGLYFILVFLCSLAIAIFILELLSKNSSKIKRILDYVN